MEKTKLFRTDGEVPEIGLKTFYEMTDKKREEHICALQSIPFDQLSQRDLCCVHFWFQNWTLTDWPSKKKNFISLDELENVHIGALSVEINKLTYQQILDSGKESVYDYLQAFFQNEYPDWETNVRFHNIDNFVNSTRNFMQLNEQTVNFIKAYKELLYKNK